MESFTYSHRRSYRRSDLSEDELGKGPQSSSGQAAPSRSSQSCFDEQRILAKKGTRVLSSMSDLLVVLARSGIPGPKDLKALNLDGRAMQIGSGSQFTVFMSHPSSGGIASKGYADLDGLVVKRVKMTNTRENGEDLVEGHNYRRHLMSLELEIIALCHPGIQKNRNIARLISWGRDYLDPETPLPVLFMEAASCSLDEFLDQESRWHIKYQLALDISSGLETLHKYHIVHGDMKPGNILVFEQQNPKVPFVAKLSDFGLCIDLFNSKSELRIDDYLGTRDWNAPELLKKNQFEIITGTSFDPIIMLKFDTYSYGLVLVSIFCTKLDVSRLDTQEGTRAQAAVDWVRGRLELPSSLKSKLCLAVRGLLDDIPSKRPPPSPELLRIDDLISYQDWVISIAFPPSSPWPGGTDPQFNREFAFWARLDKTVLTDMVKIASSRKELDLSAVHAEALFGLALGLSTPICSDYIEDMTDFIQRAANAGYVPAQGICSQILRAHKRHLPPVSVLRTWERNSLETGFFFHTEPGSLTQEEAAEARDEFRRSGGHCRDSFMSISSVIDTASNPSKLADFISEHGPYAAIDLEGNTIAHVVAALGIPHSLRSIFNKFPEQVLKRNDNGETLLYKSCQAGQMDILRILRDTGIELTSIATLKDKITPLHWLFTFKDACLSEACEYLMGPNRENINAQMVPETSGSHTYHPNNFPMMHYPFEFPYGTPLHWASAARNFAAMQVLLRSGAAIDAPCFNNHPHSTALSLAIHFGDLKLASFLISKGANPHVMDLKQRTLLHRLSYRLPELHGSHPHQWHYWVRHGPWEEHKKQMSEMVELLVRAGLSLEAYSSAIPPLTPVLTAAASDLNNGGAIHALVTAGADIDTAKGTCKDSVLISWSGIAQEKLFYPVCYSEVMKLIINKTKDLGYANEQGETALHMVAATNNSQEQFRSNVFALLSQNPPTDIKAIDINARDQYGNTPLLLSLMGEANAMYQAAILLDGGADIYVVNDCGENVFGVITANKFFMDENSAAHIMKLLLRVNVLLQLSFKKFESSSKKALWNASAFARPKTLQLLLDLGMSTHINEVCRRDQERTALDLALDGAEGSRGAYINKCARYGKTFSAKQVEDSDRLYDDRQGGPESAREAYWAFPTTINILRKHGAKRAWELGPEYSCENIEQPGDFDLNNIYALGFTPDTQPYRQHWSVLYELAKYRPGWKEAWLERVLPWYEDGTWRPEFGVLSSWSELREELEKRSENGWIKAISEENLMVEVKMKDGKIVNRRIVNAAS